jgi:hypothetical protein
VGRTSISGAIDFSISLLADKGFEAIRQVIDISGDGPNNEGRAVTHARDEAVAKGVTINGLPIMLKGPQGIWDIENLDLYFRDCVIGGPGAFTVPVRERHQFTAAIKTKVIREVSEKVRSEPNLQPAQAEVRANCFAGRWGN